MWGFGCIVYQMAALTPPFTGPTLERLFHAILTSAYKPLPLYRLLWLDRSTYSQSLHRLVATILDKNPSKRPFIEDLVPLFHERFAIDRPIDRLNYQNCCNRPHPDLQPVHDARIVRQFQAIKNALRPPRAPGPPLGSSKPLQPLRHLPALKFARGHASKPRGAYARSSSAFNAFHKVVLGHPDAHPLRRVKLQISG